ncbi:Sphingosine-1-phosphate lyase, partial [Geodia barretti]
MFYHAFLHENALNPMVFPSLARFETETVAMAAGMLHGNERVVGSVTSGGTESILMAVKTYRDRARDLWPHITQPEMVAPQTIHPAFEKAASYFNVTVVHVPLNPDLTPNMAAYEKAISTNTILLLCSAPEYCYGMVDPVPTISGLAIRHNLPLHVDACFGGFMLPWVEKLGYSLPEFDFRLPGVTSMSADIHKYGLGIKASTSGSSVAFQFHLVTSLFRSAGGECGTVPG